LDTINKAVLTLKKMYQQILIRTSRVMVIRPKNKRIKA
jgi:hypothetical protein